MENQASSNPNPSDESKDCEVRARVAPETYAALARMANGRGEKLPVIVREALAEYLARRLESTTPANQRAALLEALHDKPEVVRALLDLASVLKPETGVNYRKTSKKDTERKLVDILKKKVDETKAQNPAPHSK